jgi:hypothetical protein
VFRQQARPQEAHHPDVRAAASPRRREPVSLSGLGLRQVRALCPVRDPDARTAGWPLAPVSSLEPAWHLELVSVIPRPEARRDVRAASYRGVRQAGCPEPASRSEQASLWVMVCLSVQVWRPERARPVSPSAPRVQAQVTVSPWAPARAVPEELLQLAAQAASALGSGVPRAVPEAAVPVCAAAELQPAAALPASGARQAVPEAAVSAHAVAEPRPGAATAASGRQAAGVAAEVPDELAPAEAEAPAGPQVAAEAVAALLGAAVRQPAEAAPRADGAVQLRAAVPPGARAPQAARPRAVPSAAASVFRQGRSLVAAPARPRAAMRLAHAMRRLPAASRSEPWWQAARNED